MLYYVKRPSDEDTPVFTRFGGLSTNRATARSRALSCGGRLYETDGHVTNLLADFYVEPTPTPKPGKREYWRARNQAAMFT